MYAQQLYQTAVGARRERRNRSASRSSTDEMSYTRAQLEAMDLDEVQRIYQEVYQTHADSGLKAFHHRTRKNKLIDQLENAEYFGTVRRAPLTR